MATDLIVEEGQRLDLDASPPPDALRSVEVVTLNDLVEHSFVGSESILQLLLNSAQEATQLALSERRTFEPVPGTLRREDLHRFSTFIAGARGVHPGQAQQFWNIVRQLPPSRLISGFSTSTRLEGITATKFHITVWFFQDVTIQPSANLLVKGAHFICRHLLIKATGRMTVKGSGLYLRAASVQGL
jgi:hypothetical protein